MLGQIVSAGVGFSMQLGYEDGDSLLTFWVFFEHMPEFYCPQLKGYDRILFAVFFGI